MQDPGSLSPRSLPVFSPPPGRREANNDIREEEEEEEESQGDRRGTSARDGGGLRLHYTTFPFTPLARTDDDGRTTVLFRGSTPLKYSRRSATQIAN